MTTPIRPSDMSSGTNASKPLNPHQRVLAVAPLNSMPYIDSPHGSDNKQMEKIGPTQKDWNNIIGSAVRSGSTANREVGGPVGLLDIGECEDAYLFRVSLPGVARDNKEFSCHVEADGKIVIKGSTTTGEAIVCKNSRIFKMQTRNLCPPGHFSITFSLPGPVEEQFSGCFGTDGILEGIVKKKR